VAAIVSCLSFIGLSVTLSTKSTKFGSRYFVDRLSQGDQIWQVDIEGTLLYISELRLRGPLGRQNTEECKKIVTLFAERDEIWRNERHLCVADLKAFWRTLELFSEHKFSTADISHISCHSATKFGMVRGLGSGHLFPEFGELWPIFLGANIWHIFCRSVTKNLAALGALVHTRS